MATKISLAVARFLTLTSKGLSLMTIASLRLNTSHLSANEEALLRCQAAIELKDQEDYEAAQSVMRPLWKQVGARPDIQGLHSSVAAEVLLCVGILTGWIGNRNEIEEAQESAKNLITESMTLYESVGDINKVTVARAELAYCYWRQGALDESRILFTEALQKLTTQGNTRARALLRLSIVEWSASRYGEALRILEDNSPLFKKITNHTIRGAYHNQLALLLRNLATGGEKADYFQRVISEYEEADYQFKLAHNIIFRAHVKNNVGNILRQLSRFKEAHQYLEQARRLTLRVRDKVRTAQIDETRAQVFIAEKKLIQAESTVRHAVTVLRKSGQQCLLTDALITHGIALARLKRAEQAQFTFQKAIEVAHQVGALNKAGLAALTLIEELEELSPDTLYVAYNRASEWLAKSQGQDLLLRLNTAARKVFSKLRCQPIAEEATAEDTIEELLNKPCDLPAEVLKFEGSLIRQALAKANGSLTRAAALLSMSYQALAYILESRHKDLLKERSPIRRRSRRERAQ
jgi:tetratricopeptide (TPR) repeat protein